MRYCHNCGFQLEEEDNFCPVCGAQQPTPSAPEPTASEETPPASKPKHRFTWLIILLACTGLSVLLLLISFALGLLSIHELPWDSSSEADTTTTTETTAFTKKTTTEKTTTGTASRTTVTTMTTTTATRTTAATKRTTTAAVANATLGAYIVNSEDGYVNLREGPSLEYRKLCSIPNATVVYAEASKGGWIYVEYESYVGWVHTLELNLMDHEITTTVVRPADSDYLNTPLLLQAHTADGVNLREGPSSSAYDVMYTIPYAQTFLAYARQGDWYYVFCDDVYYYGWVHKHYVTAR